MVEAMMNDIGQGYTLTATYSGANLYTVATDPEGAIYTGVSLDELAQVYRLHWDKVTIDMMPMDFPNGAPNLSDM